jgi:hypothetical protein
VTSRPQILPKPKTQAVRITDDVRMSVFQLCCLFAAMQKILENAEFSFERDALATVLREV